MLFWAKLVIVCKLKWILLSWRDTSWSQKPTSCNVKRCITLFVLKEGKTHHRRYSVLNCYGEFKQRLMFIVLHIQICKLIKFIHQVSHISKTYLISWFAYTFLISWEQVLNSAHSKESHNWKPRIHAVKKVNITIYKLLWFNCNHSLYWFIFPLIHSLQILFKSVSECLSLADESGHKSIAFPAIGTGGLGFSKTEVAQIMSNAVATFAQRSLKKMDIYFVIYPSDNYTFKVGHTIWGYVCLHKGAKYQVVNQNTKLYVLMSDFKGLFKGDLLCFVNFSFSLSVLYMSLSM